MKLTKKRIIVVFSIVIILFQIIFPSVYSYGIEMDNMKGSITNESADKNENIIENTISNEDTEIISEISDVENQDDFEIQTNQDDGISVASASGYGTGAGNENEFRNAFYNTNVSELTTSRVIRLTSTYTVNHNIRINSSSTSGENSIHLSSGCNIVVPNGCVLTLDRRSN